MDFLDKISKISGLQSGNRKFYSTETARLHYTDQLLQNTDENEYLLLYYLTCLKLSTASNGKTYYRGCTYWVCLTPLWPGLRATYHYASKWSGSAVSYPTPPTDSRCGIGVHSRSSFVHVVRQQPPLCSEEVRSRGLCRRHQAAIPDLNSVPQLTQKISLPHVVLLGKNIKPSPVLELPECIIYVASIELNIFWTTKLLPLLSMLLFSAGFSIVLPYGVIPPAHSELRLQNSLGIKNLLMSLLRANPLVGEASVKNFY